MYPQQNTNNLKNNTNNVKKQKSIMKRKKRNDLGIIFNSLKSIIKMILN